MSTRNAGDANARAGHPGDVGRRVEHRREQLGLTREEAATRARMDPGFLEYLESQPTAIQLDSLTRLAGALETSVRYLLGGGLDTPPGRTGPTAHPELAELDPSECWAKLSPGGIGRVALSTPDGPMALPVNYRVLDGTVLYRTAEDSVLARVAGHRVAFEVDQLDEALSTGWSILLTGTAEQVTGPEAVQRFEKRADPHPWAGGHRDTWIRIRPTSVTGRVIRTIDPPPPV
ncbi:helix-turn-helix domain-containing protein [Kitasatospora sp. NPDC127111]|uniref:helix-turn-helix domain-containing protein n=1 Tax=Kitasatospora sp. NPDC127111 TaxID=3345363 RepID=UPI00362EEA2F